MCDDFKWNWHHELRLMREAMKDNRFDISSHLEWQRMKERCISIIELAEVIMTGEIVEGYNTGEYPGYFNKDSLRTIVGKTSKGRILTIGIAMQYDETYSVTTAYPGIPNRINEKIDKGFIQLTY